MLKKILLTALLVSIIPFQAYAERLGIGAGIGQISHKNTDKDTDFGDTTLLNINANFGIDTDFSVELSIGRSEINSDIVNITMYPIQVTIATKDAFWKFLSLHRSRNQLLHHHL